MKPQAIALHPLRKARGKRALALRKALRFSRRAFAERYADLGLKASTLQSWEDGRFGGLTESGAEALCQAFRAEGVICNPQWLLYGTGPDPLAQGSPATASTAQSSSGNALAKELQLFHEHHPNAIDAIVPDNGLAPFFQAGDLVAGKRFFDAAIKHALTLPCIIQTQSGDIRIRLLKKSRRKGLYDLHALSGKKELNVAVFSAAPILWFRRQQTQ